MKFVLAQSRGLIKKWTVFDAAKNFKQTLVQLGMWEMYEDRVYKTAIFTDQSMDRHYSATITASSSNRLVVVEAVC